MYWRDGGRPNQSLHKSGKWVTKIVRHIAIESIEENLRKDEGLTRKSYVRWKLIAEFCCYIQSYKCTLPNNIGTKKTTNI